MNKIGVLGGGLAGMLAALELAKKTDAEITVFEKSREETDGGLLRSLEFVEGRQPIDVGGPHILFSKNKEVLGNLLDFLPGKDKFERNTKIYLDGMIIDYPLENGMYALPKETRAKISEDFVGAENDETPQINSLGDFFLHTFKKTLFTKYFYPYNAKVWKTSPFAMESTWTSMSGRLPIPNKEDRDLALSGVKTVGYKEQSSFWYPSDGGIYSLYRSIKKRAIEFGVKILYDSPVRGVSFESDKQVAVKTSKGRLIADKVVSTIPLTKVYKMLTGEHSNLRFNPVVSVSVLAKMLDFDPRVQSMYIPDMLIPFHRLNFPDSLTDLRKDPDGFKTIVAEYTGFGYYGMEEFTLINLTIAALKHLKLVSRISGSVRPVVIKMLHGYPVDVLGTTALRNAEISEVEASGKILCTGRFGRWQYWNMDKVYESVQKDVISKV